MSTATEEPRTSVPSSPAAERRRRIAVRALVVLVALALSAFFVFATLVDLPGGPLGYQGGNGVGQGRLKVGDVVTFQFPQIDNPTGHTIRLRSIEPDHVDPGIAVLGIRIAPEGLDQAVVAHGWPPRQSITDTPVFPVDGYELSSRGTGDRNDSYLIVGVRLTQPGRHRINGFRLHYRDRLVRRVATIGDWLEVSGR